MIGELQLGMEDYLKRDAERFEALLGSSAGELPTATMYWRLPCKELLTGSELSMCLSVPVLLLVPLLLPMTALAIEMAADFNMRARQRASALWGLQSRNLCTRL